tara:strand:+ start:744 stop:2036 length:1293 start_codon:yes stop_codon:yes gene_type:complete
LVSGGIDSQVLLSNLLLIKKQYSLNLFMLHVNYNLHNSAMEMQEICSESAQKNNLKIFIKSKSLDSIKSNIESIARKIRYDEAIKICNQQDIDYILTAHHEDDQIETIYMAEQNNVSWVSKIGIRSKYILNDSKDKQITIIRPLLKKTKEEIVDYSKKYNIKYIDDPSNKDECFARNKVRLKIKDKVNDYDFRSHHLNIARTNKLKMIKISKSINDNYSQIIKTSIFDEICILKINELMKHSFDFVHLYLKKILFDNFDFKNDLSKNKWISIHNFINSKNQGKSFAICNYIEISKNKDYIYLYKSNSTIQNNKINSLGNHYYILGCLTVYKATKYLEFDNKEGICIPLDYKGKLEIKNWTHGDKFEIKNNKNSKVSDLFIDNKLSLFHKKNYPIIKYNDRIIWIPYMYSFIIEKTKSPEGYLVLIWNIKI